MVSAATENAHSMTPDPDLRARFLAGMSHAAATVNVVTTDGAAGRVGVTVSAMSSVSADTPRPTLLVCIHQNSPAAEAVLTNGVFCVNVLRDDQSYISDTFAGRFREQVADKFDCAEWSAMDTGAPRAVDPLVAFDCRVVSSDLVGTHHVVFGEVGDVFVSDHGSPLIYARRAYGAAARIDTPSSIDTGRAAATNRLRIACFFTISAFTLPPLLRGFRDAHGDTEISLIEGDQSRIQSALAAGEADIALMYDENISNGLEKEVLLERAPYVLLPEDHPLASQDVIPPDDLAKEPMVLLATPPAPEYFLSLLREHGVEPRIAYRSGTIETVRGLVANGLGFSLLASRPATDVSYDGRRLVTRPLGGTPKPSRVMLVSRGGGALPPAADRFAALCRRRFGTAKP